MTLRAFVLLATTAVAACGGGYKETTSTGGGTTPPPPTTTVTPAAVRLFASSAQMLATADTQAEGDTLTAVVTDANSNTISGTVVTFAITSGTGAIIVTQGTTDSTGTATAVLTTGGDATFPRTITVTATAGAVTSTSVSISVVDPAAPPVTPASIAGISMFASDAQLFDDADTAAEGVTLTAVVTNAQGNVVSGVPVSFTVTTGPAALVVSRGTTDSTGTAVATLTTNGVRTARNVTITASVTSGSTTFTSPVTLPVIGHAKKIIGTITGLRLNQSGSLSVTARAEDDVGNPVGNVPITFVVTAGAVTPATMTTNASGATVNPAGGNSAVVTAGASVAPGSVIHITMTAPGATADSADILVVPDVAAITIRASSNTLKADADTVAEGVTVTAVATDASGQLLSDERINFSLKDCSGSAGTATGGGLTPGSIVTDASGNASSVVTTGGANPAFGKTVNVSASSASNPLKCSPLALTIVDPNAPAAPPAAVARVDAFAASSQLFADADTSEEGVSVSAIVTDSAGNTVSGVAVAFSISSSTSGTPGALEVSRGTTDSTGTALAVLTTGGNANPRNITVTASVPSATVQPTGTVQVAVIGHATKVLGTISALRINKSGSLTVNARAEDANGNPVPNVPVTFVVSGGLINGASSAAITTGASGATTNATIAAGTVPAGSTIHVTMTAPGATADSVDVLVVPDVSSVTLRASSSNLKSDADTVAEGVTVTAAVADVTGALLDAERVSFALVTCPGPVASVGALTPGSATTDQTGMASAVVTTGGSTPAVGAKVCVQAASLSNPAKTSSVVTLTVVDPNTQTPSATVAKVDVFASDAQLFADADTAPEGVTITALATDSAGNTVSGAGVAFSLVSPSIGALQVIRGTTDASGTATATLTTGGDTSQRDIVVQAAITGVTAKTVKLPVWGRAKTITGTLNSLQLPSNDSIPVILHASAVDESGNPVANVPVTFFLSSGGISGAGSTPCTPTSGRCIILVTDSTGQTADATIDTGGDPTVRTITVTMTGPGAQAASANVRVVSATNQIGGIALTLGSNTPVADTAVQTAVRVVVTDSAGETVNGATVSFATSAGTFSGGATTTATTDVNGIAQVLLTSPSTTGAATITASSGGVNASQSINFVAGAPANPLVISASRTLVPLGQTAILRVTVKDANGNGVPGQTVNFDLPTNGSGGSVGASAVTDSFGVATTTYVAGSVAGADTVKAAISVSGITPVTQGLSASSTGVAQGLTLTASQSSIPADNTSTSTLTAKLTDTGGQPIAGQALTFTTSAGTISLVSATTAADGTFVARLTAGTVAGRATVTVRHAASGLSAAVPVTLTAGPAASVSLSVAPGTVRPGGTASLDVTVLDVNSNPVSGEFVSLDVMTNNSGGLISSAALTTDANGRATTTYSAGTTTGVTDTLRARLANPNGAGTDTSDVVINAAAAQIASIALSVGDVTPVASTATFTVVRAVVTDTAGNLVNGADVSFSSTAGAFSNSPTALVPTSSAPTNTSGSTQLFLQSPDIAGSAIVRVSTGGFTASQPITFVAGAPNTVLLSATPQTITFGKTTTLRATVTDANGNLVPDETVTFKVTANGSAGVLGGATVVTDASGAATTSWQAGAAAFASTSDSFSARVSNSGVAAGTATVTVSATRGSITVSAAGSSIVADGVSTTTINTTVKDQDGTPVSGAPVTCSTSAGTIGAAGSTGSNGTASATLTSSTHAGNAVVLCGVTGLSGTAVVQFVAGAPNSVVLAASPGTVSQAGTSTITATVTDANGNVVPNEPLAFSISVVNTGAPSLSTASVTTDSSGRATVTYTGGTTAATDTVKALTAGNKSGTTPVTVSANTQVVQTLGLSIGGVAAFPTSVQVATNVGLRGTVVDTSGAPVAGVTVTFTSTDGTFVGAVNTAVSDSNGHADVTLTTPNYATSGVIVTASASGLLAQGQMTIIPGPAVVSTSAITANPSTLIADGQSTTTVTVILNDAQGNPVADGRPVTLITSPNGAGTFLPGNSTVTASGRATFTVQSPSTSSTATIKVQDLPTLFTNVTFASPSANTTGDPASIGFVASATTISVAGVGQTEQLSITATVRDSAGKVIAEGDNTTGYGNTAFNNLRVEFVTQPHGSESITGKNGAGDPVSSSDVGNPCGPTCVDVRTNNGVAVLTLHSGTIAGIVELKFTVKAFDQVTNIATGSLPQISIASGPPHTIAFTHPVTNSVEDLTGGSYRRRGQAIVTDRYGNHVPDGTVVNLTLIDSVIAQGNGGTIGASSTLTGGGNLLERVCTTPPPPSGGEASGCGVRGALAGSSDFNRTLTRNNTSRGIQANDHIYVLNADTFDKSRVTSGSPATGSTVGVQTPYLYTYSQPAINTAQYWIGASLSGGFISGCTVADASCTGSTLTTGTGIVFDGIAGFRVTYPANVGSILLGCYGYQPSSPSYAPTQYHDKDLRDPIPQSRQVVIAASSGDGATGVNVGEFCFAPITGSTMTPTIDSVLASPTVAANPASPQVSLSFQLRDGGDTVPLPYVPISCYESERSEDSTSDWTVTIYSVLHDGAWETFVDGFGYVKVDIVGTMAKDGDSTTITCLTTGGFEAASTSFLINVR